MDGQAGRPDQRVHAGEADRWGGWVWNEPRHGEHFRRCSYCGSVHPEDLAAEPAWQPEWADQKYLWPHKFYVDIPNRNSGALFVRSCGSGGEPPTVPDGSPNTVARWDELTAEQLAIVERDHGYYVDGEYRPEWFEFGPRSNHFGKFYTVHLRDAGLPAQVKTTIEQRSGVAFTFTGNEVTWRPAMYEQPH